MGIDDYTLVNEHIRWGLIVVAYLFLAGLGAGTVVAASLPKLPWVSTADRFRQVRRAALLTAAGCFAVVPLAVIADLGQPWRMWRVLILPNETSAMPYGSWVLSFLLIIIILDIWVLHRPHLARSAAERDDLLGRVHGWLALGAEPRPLDDDAPPSTLQTALGLLAVILALGFVAYTGFLLSTMTSFGLWYTPLLAVVFAFAALAAGFAWLAVLAGVWGRSAKAAGLIRLLSVTAAVFLGAHLATRLWDLAHAAYVENDLWPAARELLLNRMAFTYIGLEMIGSLVAIVLLALAARSGSRGLAVAGGGLTLVALLASRYNIVFGGQSISRTGQGFVTEELHWLGREGVFAATGLFVWAAVIGLFLAWFLPWYPRFDSPSVADAEHDTSGQAGREPVALAGPNGRRLFFGLAGAAGLAFVAGIDTVRALARPSYKKHTPGPSTTAADRVVHSICLSCDARCGNRAIVRDGVVRNLFGNPYHPASTMNSPIGFDTSAEDSLRSSGSLCMKGVSGLQYLYDPYRIRLPLKRTGPRGSGQFEPISWGQLITEVVEGGRLFEGIGEDREVEGLRAIRNLDEPINADAPELGPKSYGLVWNTGRGQPGRQEFIERFMEAFGSTNYVSHTDLCQMNYYVANYLFTGRYNGEAAGHSQLFGDINNSQYMLFFGVNLGGGWKPGVNTSAPILATRHARGDGTLILIDPYVPHGRHYADEWVPIKPGADAALALGMLRWIMDNERFDRTYLENTSQQAADADGESTWLNGTYLVIQQPGDARDRRFLRARDVGLGDDEYVVVNSDGELSTHLETDAGELFVTRSVTDTDGTELQVRSALQLSRDEAFSRSPQEWADLCGVPAERIEALADGFTSHGKQATASFYRGAVMHSQGMYAGWAIHLLNAMVGNFNWRGGVGKNASAVDWEDGLYTLGDIPDAPQTSGVHISRIGSKSTLTYEESSEYQTKVDAGQNPYPPQRPWYPFTHAGITTEALAGADSGYPYGVKCYINYYINSRHSIPGGIRFEETFGDPEKIPLFISVDTTVSETSVYSDYIVPDVMYLDGQWGFMGQPVGAVPQKHSAIRTPVIEPLTGRTDDGRAMFLETFLIDVAEALSLPGYGTNGIVGAGPHEGQRFALHTAEDYYLRGVANMSFNAETPQADDADLDFVERGYPVAAHKDTLPPDEWRSAAYLLARGGYFDDPESAWDENGHAPSGIKVAPLAPLQVWHEELATATESASGRLRPGTAAWIPAVDGRGEDLEERDAEEFPFRVVTFRLATRTKARTAYDYWALETHPTNHLEVNPTDARRLDIVTGDRVRVASRSGEVEATIKVSPRVSPGVVAGTHHYGHTQQGNSALTITDAVSVMSGTREFSPVMHGLEESITDGNQVLPDRKRGSGGFNINDAMRRNENDLGSTPLVDSAGGATIFLDSRVKLEKI
ncbi:MAG: NrfD/PsrC family molybdoenzyme membrane anchor subunit [Dermatophilaceae bacterium]|nr:polysulfide reductase NrfD [Intrasporangiaceae bacterium]